MELVVVVDGRTPFGLRSPRRCTLECLDHNGPMVSVYFGSVLVSYCPVMRSVVSTVLGSVLQTFDLERYIFYLKPLVHPK